MGALYYTEYRAVIRLTDMVGMKLSPMDTEKAHIAGALVRSILELGHPSESRFGIDPKRKAQASKRKWCKYFIIFEVTCLGYKLKRQLTKMTQTHKQISVFAAHSRFLL